MANSELSKLKTLVLWDYFVTQTEPNDRNNSASTEDIIEYLNNVLGVRFERKSIYADIDKLNDYARTMDLVVGGAKFIERDGRVYTRKELKNELTMDESRLIVDAINSTPFIESKICEKIKRSHSKYFKKYKSLASHYKKSPSNISDLLNKIRAAMEDGDQFEFEYGYLIAGDLRRPEKKLVTPLELDWENNKYYLIAIDHASVDSGKSPEESIKRYRLDRIKKYKVHYGESGISISNRNTVLKTYFEKSVDSYSADETYVFLLTLKADTEKNLLKAYGAFDDKITNTIQSDRTSAGSLVMKVVVGVNDKKKIVPTFFVELFKLSTFDGITFDIDDNFVKKQYKEYLDKALGGCIIA